MGLLGGDRGGTAVGAGGRHHGGRGGGGRVVTGDLAGDGAKLGHGDRTQAGALGHGGRRCGHCRRGEGKRPRAALNLSLIFFFF